MSGITITLPPVDSRLHAHNKGHWRAKSTATKQLRELAQALVTQKGRGREQWRRACVHYRFYVPDNRRRDTANMIQATKPAIDGLVDAGLIKDDCWQHLSIGKVSVEIDRNNPRVVLRVNKVGVDED